MEGRVDDDYPLKELWMLHRRASLVKSVLYVSLCLMDYSACKSLNKWLVH